MTPVAVNTRRQSSALTGLQRYTAEVISRFRSPVEHVTPKNGGSRGQGQLWEQVVLPRLVRGKLLFSPANTGPLSYAKQVVTIHDVFQLDHPELMKHRVSAWYRFLTPRLARRVAHVITISEFSKDRLLAKVPMDGRRVTVIPNGVDDRFRPYGVEELEREMPSLGLPSPHYVLCVGSLEPRKNIGNLLRAWAQVVNSVPQDIWLVLTGKQSDAGGFVQHLGSSELPPRVHITGHVSDASLPALYAGALIFAFPSFYEGFGLPPLEAMASGVPVLTGNQTSLPEVVGDAGIMVNPFDVDAIAHGLLRLVDDSALRSTLRSRGLERARQFSWDVTAQKTWAVLNSFANE